MSQPNQCPQCGTELPASAPRGLCPACLLKRGLETNTAGYTGDEPQAAHWTPPGLEELAARFPELEIIRLVGRGGMGAVYQARQKNLDRVVALKILPPEIGRDPAFAERFAREAQAMAKLSHPHIVTIHEFGEREHLFFFVMEYVDGLNLRQVLATGKVTPQEALGIVPQICDALQYAHDHGIVHRDIKPENILLSKRGQVKIADFGLAKLMGRTAPGEAGTAEKVMGTPQYMAPEQLSRPGEVDHRADIYALGVVFYQMLTGELPKGEFEPPSRKVVIDVRLDEVVLRAMEKEPERRYQQASQIKTEVETIADTATPSVSCESLNSARSGRLAKWIMLLGAILLILVAWKPFNIVDIHTPVFLLLVLLFGVIASRLVSGEMTSSRLTKIRPYALVVSGSGFLYLSMNHIGEIRGMLQFGVGIYFIVSGILDLVRGDPTRRSPPATPAGNVVPQDNGGQGGHSFIGQHVPHQVSPQPSNEPKHSRHAIIGAVWAPFAFIAFLLAIIIAMPASASQHHGPAWWQILLQLTVLPLGVTAPFGTTILGCVAISQIRRSNGRLYGLPMAIFDALLFPLLVLSGLILAAGLAAARMLTDFHANLTPPPAGFRVDPPLITQIANFVAVNRQAVILIALVVALLADVLIIRRVWRATHTVDEAAKQQPSKSPAHRRRLVALALVALTLVIVVVVLQNVVPQSRRPYSSVAPIGHTATESRRIQIEAQLREAIAQHLRGDKDRADRGEYVDFKSLTVEVSADLKQARAAVTGLQPVKVSPGFHQVRGVFVGGFELRYAGGGIWEITGTEGLKGRHLEVSTADIMADATADKSRVFGPVIEQTLGEFAAISQAGLDFDGAVVRAYPFKDDSESWDQIADWIHESGVDLWFEDHRLASGVFGIEMQARQVPESTWDMPAQRVLQELRLLPPPPRIAAGTGRKEEDIRKPFVMLAAPGQAPSTHLIKTREGGMGVLQILGFTDKNRGVKVRYKMLRAAVEEAATRRSNDHRQTP